MKLLSSYWSHSSFRQRGSFSPLMTLSADKQRKTIHKRTKLLLVCLQEISLTEIRFFWNINTAASKIRTTLSVKINPRMPQTRVNAGRKHLPSWELRKSLLAGERWILAKESLGTADAKTKPLHSHSINKALNKLTGLWIHKEGRCTR